MTSVKTYILLDRVFSDKKNYQYMTELCDLHSCELMEKVLLILTVRHALLNLNTSPKL